MGKHKTNVVPLKTEQAPPSMTAIELVGAAEQLRQKGSSDQILSLYAAWIEANEEDPLLYAILFNFGVVQTDSGDIDGAKKSFERSLSLNPNFTPSSINLGRIYERLGETGQSVNRWNEAVAHLAPVTGLAISHKVTALNQMARVLEANNKDDESEAALKESLQLDPSQYEVLQHYIADRQRLCEWPIVMPFERVDAKKLRTGISPLSMSVYTDDPMFQLACSAHYNKAEVALPTAEAEPFYWLAKAHPVHEPLRIGYLSSDLREHAIGFLMAELFALHDRKNVEVFVYYCGSTADDPMMQHIKKGVDHWVSITEMDDADADRRIRDDRIQILVDVNAYTRDGRTKLVARRPAPVIVNWLGFPGSSGSPYHHYIIADEWIIPPEYEKYYSEKVLRLPCYQPNNRQRVIAPRMPSRADAKLPEGKVVYCCFNGTQKISRATFDRWIKILKRVPESVLWLLSGPPSAEGRLRAYAQERGIASDRLIFAEKLANPFHLARYPLADLFLDTAPYGAHTTASDALWMGVPVVTFAGKSFASRVCGSLVRSAGLADLACETADEYVDTAVSLGNDKATLEVYRKRLEEQKGHCDLFNTPKLARHLEDLYAEMWRDCLDDRLPQPDLTNLETYFEIGVEQEYEAIELQTLDDEKYEQYWQQLLANYHRFRPIQQDRRLWSAQAQKKACADKTRYSK